MRTSLDTGEAYAIANNIDNLKRGDLPAIQMDAADHRMTASWGPSKSAITYREQQAMLIANGDMHAAIQMDIDDIHSKFGTKYD